MTEQAYAAIGIENGEWAFQWCHAFTATTTDEAKAIVEAHIKANTTIPYAIKEVDGATDVEVYRGKDRIGSYCMNYSDGSDWAFWQVDGVSDGKCAHRYWKSGDDCDLCRKPYAGEKTKGG